MMANSVGVIEPDYCGDNDVWGFVAYAVRDTVICKGTRIAQFMPVPMFGDLDFDVVDSMPYADRGGYGSTGTKASEPRCFDADGVPIEVGDEVYFFDEKANEPVVGYGPFRVIGFDAEEGAVKLRYEEGGTDHYGKYSEEFEPAETLTHRKPDSWEQLEDDSLLSVDEYRNLTGIDCNEGAYFAKQRDLIRRAKRLAGVNDDQ